MILTDCYKTWYGEDGGIFKDVYRRSEQATFLDGYVSLDIQYFGNHSGNKTVSPLIDKLVSDTEVYPFGFDETIRDQLATTVWTVYGAKWTRLYDALNAEYEAITGVSLTESIEIGSGRVHSVSDDYKTTETRATDTNYSTTTETGTNSEAYGFNSNSPVPTADAAGNSTVTVRGSGTGNKETVTNEQTGSVQDDYSEETTKTREGRDGSRTAQELIESEWRVRMHDFYEQLFKDVDTVLTVPKYSY